MPKSFLTLQALRSSALGSKLSLVYRDDWRRVCFRKHNSSAYVRLASCYGLRSIRWFGLWPLVEEPSYRSSIVMHRNINSHNGKTLYGVELVLVIVTRVVGCLRCNWAVVTCCRNYVGVERFHAMWGLG